MSAPLAKAVRLRADALIDLTSEQQEDISTDLYRLAREVAELALVLARTIEGKPLLRAFGAPGDWGYGTPLGAALAQAATQQGSAA